MNGNYFPGRLRELRTKAGLTQDELASLVGMNKFSIAQFEQGRNRPSWDSVIALASALNVEVTAFLEEPSPEQEPRGRGRPKKEADPTPAHAKRPRGRPRKQSAGDATVSSNTTGEDEHGGEKMGQAKPAATSKARRSRRRPTGG